MKKAIVIFLLSCMFSLYASTWEVVALGGKAAILKKGVWVDLQVGDTLENEDVITTYINSSLVIQKADRKVSIKPMRKGTVSEVIEGKRATFSQTYIAPASDKSSKAVITAASRASSAKEDLDWDENE